ncbi:MAG: hypothetical protein HYT14_02200 [Candidatus Liptonbacteria bacterium]|nr:hypothetical protein [Candidatus Liptonbacteria bacterium]
MSDREKELTILIAEGCQITRDMLPHWEYCRNLALRMHRHLGGTSIKFSVISGLICEFRRHGKFVATIYFHDAAPDELRIHACNHSGGEIPRTYPLAQAWEKAFRPALASLLFEERQTLDEVERKLCSALPL